MGKCLCGFICRSKNESDCENGKYFYRCANLNVATKEYYDAALEKALEYDFNGCRIGEPRQDFEYARKEGRNAPCPAFLGEISAQENNEAFICRCFTRIATGFCKKTECRHYFSFQEENAFEIIDYQVPPIEGNCGRVDLVFESKTKDAIYFVEVKPYRTKGAERLLRMICEILSYFYPLADEKSRYRDFLIYKSSKDFSKRTWKYFLENRENYPQNGKFKIVPSIAFFEDSEQHKEYLLHESKIEALMNKQHIAVFCISKDGKINLLKQY